MITKMKRLFFQKISKTDKLLAKPAKRKIQINKNGDQKGDIKTDTNKFQKIIRPCLKSLYFTYIEYLKEMGEILDACSPPTLAQVT